MIKCVDGIFGSELYLDPFRVIAIHEGTICDSEGPRKITLVSTEGGGTFRVVESVEEMARKVMQGKSGERATTKSTE